MTKRVVASIEARMGSSRLPGKVLHDLNGLTVLSRLINRLQHSSLITDIVIATTTKKNDDSIQKWADVNNIACFRGSEDDVLDRVVRAQESLNSDIIVEITGDCPLLDPYELDKGIEIFLRSTFDVVTNVRQPSYPQGVDVQVFSYELLKYVADNINDRAVREHVSLYFYENPTQYSIYHMCAPPDICRPELRLQLDYTEDLALLNCIYSFFGDNSSFTTKDVINYLDNNPALLDINKSCQEMPTR